MFRSLLLLLSWAVSARGAGTNSYVMLPNTDAPNQDIGEIGTANMTYLMEVCSTDDTCMGFNSGGWLKRNVSQSVLVFANGTTLYVRQNYAPLQPIVTIWPLPQVFTNGGTAVGIDSRTFRFSSPRPFPDLTEAFRRYSRLMFVHVTETRPAGPVLDSLAVSVAQPSVPLQMGVDESYSLLVPADGTPATLSANTYYGAIRGLETFSQMVAYNFSTLAYGLALAPWSIKDAPRFPHRGMLVDTSRHFEPIRTLKQIIDSMSYAKFNVLHWHMVDTQAFPIQSKTYPLLWEGSYSPAERYSQADMAELVEFARKRGIRIVPEFDVPGHAGSWCVGYPAVCPSATCTQPLNPANPATFALIESLWGEMTGSGGSPALFPDNLFHLGGDEVDTSCWTDTPAVAAWLAQNNFTAQDAYGYFVEKAHAIIIAQGRTPMNWAEVYLDFGHELDPQTILQVWIQKTQLAQVVAGGYRALLSDIDDWYLAMLSVTWSQMYLNEPFENITSPQQQALILGGEACMWGEWVDTSDIQTTIWPRAAAIAERLWSPQVVNDVVQALPRIEWFRCLLTSRGIPASPVNNDQGGNGPVGTGPCAVQ